MLQTDLNIVDNDNGMTHMHWAALADDGELKRLIKIGVFTMNPKINTEGKFGVKAKRRAQLLGHNLEDWHRDGETPLHLAAWAKAALPSILIANGADVHAKDKNDLTPLHFAAEKNATETAALLLKNGADVNAKNNDGSTTPLHWAAYNGRNRNSGAPAEKRRGCPCENKDGYTPLHLAAYNNATETAALLLKNGADVNAKSNEDATPLDYCNSILTTPKCNPSSSVTAGVAIGRVDATLRRI